MPIRASASSSGCAASLACGKSGSREAEEAVGAELQEDAGEDHRAARGRLDVGVRQPGVEGEHRHLDGESQREGREEPELLLQREIEPQQVPIGEAPDAAVQALERPGHPQDGDQHQQAPRHGEEEKLDGRIDLSFAAPDADQQIHRDEHDLPEDVEEEEVMGEKRAEDAGGQQQQGSAEQRPVGLDALPRAEHHDRQQQDRQQHQRHGDAVDGQVVSDAETGDPGDDGIVDQREAAVRADMNRQVDDAEGQLDQGGNKHVDLRQPGLGLGEEEQRHRRDRRKEDQARQRVAEEQSEKGFHIRSAQLKAIHQNSTTTPRKK